MYSASWQVVQPRPTSSGKKAAATQRKASPAALKQNRSQPGKHADASTVLGRSHTDTSDDDASPLLPGMKQSYLEPCCPAPVSNR